MNRSFATFLGLVAFASIATGAPIARDANAPAAPPPPNPVDIGFGGLQTSLTTGGYRFVVFDTPAPNPVAGAPIAVPDTFAACASLQNRSPFEIKFTYPSAAAAGLKFAFRVFDSAGTLVWQSDTDIVTPQVETTVALGRFQRWKRTEAIPLKPGGKALAAGIYTLEALIDADKRVGASTVFEVIAGIPPSDPSKTGINGLVLKADSAPVDGQPAPTESPAAGALVVVSEVFNANPPAGRPLFNWSGKTDDLGKFKTNAPAGHYRVTASYVAPKASGASARLVYPPKTVEVEVVDQQFADVTIHLVPLATPPPPLAQGIRGHVRIASPIVANPTGEVPLPGALVSIDQVTDASGVTPFHWKGVADATGSFQVPTPPGTFKVTAAAPAGPTANAAVTPVAVDVTVAAGAYSEVTLHLAAPQPPIVQGIRGRVWIPNPVANAPGAPAEIPAVGAPVTIDQIADATGAAGFHWQGVSGPEGGFSVQTPPGSYKVTASVIALPPTAGGNAPAVSVTVNVTVTAGEFSEVALHIGAKTTVP